MWARFEQKNQQNPYYHALAHLIGGGNRTQKTEAAKTLNTITKRSATNAILPNATPTTLIFATVMPYSKKRKIIACSVSSTEASSEKKTWHLPFMISTPLRKGTRSSFPSGISNRTSTLHRPS